MALFRGGTIGGGTIRGITVLKFAYFEVFQLFHVKKFENWNNFEWMDENSNANYVHFSITKSNEQFSKLDSRFKNTDIFG